MRLLFSPYVKAVLLVVVSLCIVVLAVMVMAIPSMPSNYSVSDDANYLTTTPMYWRSYGHDR